MDFKSRYTKTITVKQYGEERSYEELNTFAVVRDVVATLLIIFMLVVFWPFHTVPTGYRGVVTQFGAIKGIQEEGLIMLPPWQNLSSFNVRAEEAPVENAEGSTSDTQPVTVSLTVRYSIYPDKVAEVFEKYSRTGDLASYVQTATQEAFKAVTARYSAPDLIAKRQSVATDVRTALQQKLDLYGAQVINIDMRNFKFSDSYMKAINDKVTQEQLRLAAENELKTVEAKQKQKVAIAEAEASAKVKTAEAEAKSIQLQAQALRESPSFLELRRLEVERAKADKWDGKLPQNIYAGAPVPFLNVGGK